MAYFSDNVLFFQKATSRSWYTEKNQQEGSNAMKRSYINRIVLAAVTVLLAAFCPMAAYAKDSETADLPEIRIDVLEIGKQTASLAVFQGHMWFIRADIPEDIADSGQYTITQTLPPGLTCETESLQVSLLTGSGEEIRLGMEQHYDLVIGSAEEDGRLTGRIRVSLTPAGMEYVSGEMKKGLPMPDLRITYWAFLDQDTAIGRQLISTAQLNYIDRQNRFLQVFSNKAAVCTGGLNILLTDTGKTPLSGGTFMLARPAQDTDREASDVIVELLDTGDGQAAVVYESFYTGRPMTGDRQFYVTTDSNGAAMLCGLPYGNYYLVQIGAPEGAQMMALPLPVQINEVSFLTGADGWQDSSGKTADNRIHIFNDSSSIPATGGPGITEIRALGILTLLSACLLLLLNNKKEYRK